MIIQNLIKKKLLSDIHFIDFYNFMIFYDFYYFIYTFIHFIKFNILILTIKKNKNIRSYFKLDN